MKKEPARIAVLVRMPVEMKEQLDDRAAAIGVPRNAFIILSLRKGLDEKTV